MISMKTAPKVELVRCDIFIAVDLDPKFTSGITGKVSGEKGAAVPNQPYLSPIVSQKEACPDIEVTL